MENIESKTIYPEKLKTDPYNILNQNIMTQVQDENGRNEINDVTEETKKNIAESKDNELLQSKIKPIQGGYIDKEQQFKEDIFNPLGQKENNRGEILTINQKHVYRGENSVDYWLNILKNPFYGQFHKELCEKYESLGKKLVNYSIFNVGDQNGTTMDAKINKIPDESRNICLVFFGIGNAKLESIISKQFIEHSKIKNIKIIFIDGSEEMLKTGLRSDNIVGMLDKDSKESNKIIDITPIHADFEMIEQIQPNGKRILKEFIDRNSDFFKKEGKKIGQCVFVITDNTINNFVMSQIYPAMRGNMRGGDIGDALIYDASLEPPEIAGKDETDEARIAYQIKELGKYNNAEWIRLVESPLVDAGIITKQSFIDNFRKEPTINEYDGETEVRYGPFNGHGEKAIEFIFTFTREAKISTQDKNNSQLIMPGKKIRLFFSKRSSQQIISEDLNRQRLTNKQYFDFNKDFSHGFYITRAIIDDGIYTIDDSPNN